MNKVHFIGIGGIGMSGLARIMLSKKIVVTGSDISANYVTEGLVNEGATVFIGHSAQYITPGTTVVYSSDIKHDNPEYQTAIKLQCPLFHRSDLLLHLMSDYKTLAVTGTHGKTTTSALLTAILIEEQYEPSYAIGGILNQFQVNAGHGQGAYFVAEADESDGTFLKYHPFGSIITNIDLDHMNYFQTEASLIQAFKRFASQVTSPQHLMWCGDDERLSQLNLPGINYGFNENCRLRITSWEQQGWNLIFSFTFQGKSYENIKAALVGKHNALNAAAVCGLAILVGVSEESIRNALANFAGVRRRCEKKGEVHGILVLDDYAHHPAEIKTTLQGIRYAENEKRLIAVFQPHRYSRTKDCLGMYGDIFNDIDELVITDIYGAGESPIPGLTSETILKEIEPSLKIPCRHVSRSDLLNYLTASLRPHDVVVTLGAGDITKLSGELVAQLRSKPPEKWKVGVIFGGRSTEHEISILSARNVLNSLNSDLYDVRHFGITRQGGWLTGTESISKLQECQEEINTSMFTKEILDELLDCEILFPVLHGPFGEDGTIQGMFEILRKAYIGCDYRAAAVCMDKALTKQLALIHGIATVPFISFSQHEWKNKAVTICQAIQKSLTFPVFVKPVHLGSTIGVHKVSKADQLKAAIEDAFLFDTAVLVENGIENPREIEFAVLGNEVVKTFPPGEILTNGKVYDYRAKYGQDAMGTEAKADISLELQQEGMQLAIKAYSAAGCTGMARVDFFLDQESKYWLNEINPIPGFTNNSLYPRMCAANNLPTTLLADQLIILALQRYRTQNRLLLQNEK